MIHTISAHARRPVEIWTTNARARSACVGVGILTSYNGAGASRVGRACASSLMILPQGRSAAAAWVWNPSTGRLRVLNDFRDRPPYTDRDTRSTGQAVCRPRAERVGFVAPARASTRTPSVVQSSVGCRTKDRKPCTATTERHRSGERIGEQVRLVGKVFAILPDDPVRVRRPHHEDRTGFRTQVARELQR